MENKGHLSNETLEYFTNITNSTTDAARPQWLTILDQVSVVTLNVTLFSLMLSMGAATYFKEVWSNLQRPWGSIIGMLCQFGLLPLMGFALSLALKLPPYQALAVLILTCSPGGAISNFFTYWVDGDIALSIVMTSTSSLLAFGGMPLNLLIYTSYWTDEQLKIPYFNVFIGMCFVTGPATMGLILRHFSEKWGRRVSQVFSVIGWIGVLINVTCLITISWDAIISASARVVIASGSIPIIGFVVAYAIAKIFSFSHKVGRTIGIETGCQNVVVAVNVIYLSFPDIKIRGQLILIPIVYAVLQLTQAFISILLYQVYKLKFRTGKQQIQPIESLKCESVCHKSTDELYV